VWVGQPWSQTGQVHCSFYHSLKLQLLILGDAAHATSPSIGPPRSIALPRRSHVRDTRTTRPQARA